MIFYLSKSHHQYTIRYRLLQDFGLPLDCRWELLARIRLLSYEKLFRLTRLPLGTYVFADLERLDPEETERAAIVWRTLAESGSGARLLNHPVRSMRRFELLRQLREQGINDFDVCRLTDLRPLRFPVFIRSEGDHSGSLTPLLGSPAELEAAIQRLVAEGTSRDDKLVVEFRDVRDGQGMYHRYGAHIVGSRVFASNLVFARHWVVRTWEPALQEGALLAAEQRYVESNPHEALLRPIFTMAGIEYGRMDYAVVDGRIQIFEINTNPVAPAGAHLLAGAREIDCELDATRRIPVTARFKPAWREDLTSAHWVSRGVHAVLYRLGLLGIERRVQSALRGTKRRLAAMAKGLLT